MNSNQHFCNGDDHRLVVVESWNFGERKIVVPGEITFKIDGPSHWLTEVLS